MKLKLFRSIRTWKSAFSGIQWWHMPTLSFHSISFHSHLTFSVMQSWNNWHRNRSVYLWIQIDQLTFFLRKKLYRPWHLHLLTRIWRTRLNLLICKDTVLQSMTFSEHFLAAIPQVSNTVIREVLVRKRLVNKLSSGLILDCLVQLKSRWWRGWMPCLFYMKGS